MVSVQPPCAITCINISVHVKNPKPCQPYHCLDTEILHALMGMGSAALAAAVFYPGKTTQISGKGQRLKNYYLTVFVTINKVCSRQLHTSRVSSQINELLASLLCFSVIVRKTWWSLSTNKGAN